MCEFLRNRVFSCCVFVFLQLINNNAIAANHYIWSDSSIAPSAGYGTNCGSSWSNACNQLPTQLYRGDTYYLADGSYGSYRFDDAGTTLIIIKKATELDHGIATGWNTELGNGQASFSGMSFYSNGYEINGNTRNEQKWDEGISYGIEIVSARSNGQLIGIDPEANNLKLDNIRFNKVYVHYTSYCTTAECTVNHHFAARYGGSNFYIGYSFFENISWGASILVNGVNPPSQDPNEVRVFTIENNYFKNIFGKELVSSIDNPNNVIFKNNFIKNVGGTAAIGFRSPNNWFIYNNIFWSPDSNFKFSDGIITTWTGKNEAANNVKIYGNTFYQMNGQKRIGSDQGGNNEAKNNLFIGFTPSFPQFSESNNLINKPVDIVVNAAAGNFYPSGPTVTGATLPAPYNKDLKDVTRAGVDNIWDIGVYEYIDSGSSGGTKPLSPSNLQIK